MAVANDDPARRAAVERATAAIDELGGAWRVRDVIWDLDARYGTFADLDGDGDLDYVATEMLHGEERVTTYLREEARAGNGARTHWRRVARFGAELQNRHPLLPWVVPGGASGHPAIVVPTGWAPYFVVYRTDGAGRADGAGVPLGRVLPERLSTPGGVDDVPFAITSVEPVREGRPAVVVGTLEDVSDDGTRTVHKEWRVALHADRPRLLGVRGLRAPPERVDEGTIPARLEPAAGRGACDHASDRRRTLVEPLLHDVTGDGTDDLVLLGADFAAHVLPGARTTDGAWRFGTSPATPRPLPLATARGWLGVRDQPEAGWPTATAIAFAQRDFTVLAGVSPDVVLHVANRYGRFGAASYFWTGRALVPVHRDRPLWPDVPDAPDGERGGRETTWWRDVWSDATGDGVPDALSVGIAREVRFDKDGVKRYLHDGAERTAIVFEEGESPDGPRLLAAFEVDVETPEDPHVGLPIDVSPVRVEGDREREVRCLFLRPWKVGIFVERDVSRLPGDAERRRRRAAVWLRRADAIASSPHALDACDAGRCRRGQRLSEERWRDALHAYGEAARLAVEDAVRDAARDGAARCAEALGTEDDAPTGPAPATWKAVDASAAQRLISRARRARRDGQEATERLLLERALLLAPDLAAARLRLGWKRADGAWRREPRVAVEVENRADTSYPDAAAHRAGAAEVATWRGDRLLVLARADGRIDLAERARLRSVLAHAPDHDGVHEALGHVWTGGGWARPRLVPAAQRLAELEERWTATARLETAVERQEGLSLPGVDADLPVFTARGTHHVLGLEARPERAREALGRSLAHVPARTQAFVTDLLGEGIKPWRQPHVWFTGRRGYFAAIDEHVEDEAARRALRRQSSLDLPGTTVLWCGNARLAHDLYAHTITFRTSWFALLPEDGADAPGSGAFAWFHEGLAYAVTLELLDSADTWFFAHGGTSAKSRTSLEPPTPRDRATCLAYVRQSLLDGEALTLRQVFSRGLNDLDLLASLQAWTFLRFAAAHDPDGLRRLPSALRAARDGSFATRSQTAVERAFDTDLDTLERLWRTFTLEAR